MENNQEHVQPVIQEEADFVAKTKKYRKQLTTLFIVVAIILIAILAWFLVRQSQAAKADQAIALADVEQNDSIALNLYKEAATHGTKSGDRAKVEAAIRLYKAGNYEEAVKYLDEAFGRIADDMVLATSSQENLRQSKEYFSGQKLTAPLPGGSGQRLADTLKRAASAYAQQRQKGNPANAASLALNALDEDRGFSNAMRKLFSVR